MVVAGVSFPDGALAVTPSDEFLGEYVFDTGLRTKDDPSTTVYAAGEMPVVYPEKVELGGDGTLRLTYADGRTTAARYVVQSHRDASYAFWSDANFSTFTGSVQADGASVRLDLLDTRLNEVWWRASGEWPASSCGTYVRKSSTAQSGDATGSPGALVRVPDVVGKGWSDAQTLIEKSGLVYKNRNEDILQELDTIVRQDPAAGTMVKPGDEVAVWIQ